jgi:electron transfer flavoprotein alpha subunit
MLLTVIDDQPASLGLVEFARTLSPSVEAAAFGSDPPKDLDGTVHLVRHELLTDYAPEAYGEALAQLIAQLRPAGVLATGTEQGNEIMAHAAARSGLPLATNCVAVSPGEPWRLTRIRGGGMLLEDAELTGGVKLATMVPAGLPEVTPGGSDVTVHEFVPELAAELARTRVVERTSRGGGLTLATAPVVVSGGRGVGSAEGYAVLEELAELLGGVVGCSRVATNNGWRPHSDQVGLTGTRVAPKLYIACGVSGATQHWVGCMDSKAILAINTDPEAPMMTRATYAVIGDVHEVLPAVIAEIRARSGTRP